MRNSRNCLLSKIVLAFVVTMSCGFCVGASDVFAASKDGYTEHGKDMQFKKSFSVKGVSAKMVGYIAVDTRHDGFRIRSHGYIRSYGRKVVRWDHGNPSGIILAQVRAGQNSGRVSYRYPNGPQGVLLNLDWRITEGRFRYSANAEWRGARLHLGSFTMNFNMPPHLVNTRKQQFYNTVKIVNRSPWRIEYHLNLGNGFQKTFLNQGQQSSPAVSSASPGVYIKWPLKRDSGDWVWPQLGLRRGETYEFRQLGREGIGLYHPNGRLVGS